LLSVIQCYTIKVRDEEDRMKKIEFDTINGVAEVEDFGEETDFLGSFSDHSASPEFLTYLREPFDGVRGLEVGDAVYALIAKEYGIKTI
jgi:hypothetical protein